VRTSEAKADAPSAAGPRLLLVGNPNVGKSVFFRLLTGRYVTVSNYPGTTVELTRGTGRLAGRTCEVIDTPGANSFTPNSEDERVARDILLQPEEHVVLQVADAKNLRRALFLTAELAELEIPMVLALNMWDEALDRGLKIDLGRVEAGVGAPVVPTVATEHRGFSRVVGYLRQPRPAQFRPDYGSAIEQAMAQLLPLLPGRSVGRRGLALMLLGGDAELLDALAEQREAEGAEDPAAWRAKVERIQADLAARLGEPVRLAIQRRRAAAADALVAEAVTHSPDRGAAHGLWRFLMFFLLGPAFFYLVGWRLVSFLLYRFQDGAPRFAALGEAGTLIAAHGAGLASLLLYSVSAWRREFRGGGSAAAALGRLSAHPVGGFPLLLFALWVLYRVVGVFGAGDCVDFMESEVFGEFDAQTGQYGGFVNAYLSRGLAALIGTHNIVYAFLFDSTAGLVSKGLTYSLAIVLPVVTFFFLLFSLMEDSGYLPRLALLADRAFKRIGLSGKAVLPMVMGLGCGTMATLTTRVLETRRQRLIAILLLALAVPCSAQLAIITGVLASIAATGMAIYVAVILLVFFGMGALASKVMPGEPASLILEVPPFRWPQLRNVLLKTYHRVKWFLREAVPLFLLGTACLFVAQHVGLLRWLEAAARPVVTGLLGLPASTTIGFILGFLRRDYAAVIIFDQFRKGQVGPEQALIALVVITLFVPCLAHFFVCVKELGLRRALVMDAGIFALAFLVGGLVRAFLAVTGIRVG
jgi:ferrous iron transport protein B